VTEELDTSKLEAMVAQYEESLDGLRALLERARLWADAPIAEGEGLAAARARH